MLEQDNKLITIDDLSSFLNISKTSVYHNYKNWGIPHNKFGGIIRFNTQDIKVWLETNKQENGKNNNKEKIKCHKKYKKEKVAIITTTTSQLQGKDTEGQLLQAINKKRKSL